MVCFDLNEIFLSSFSEGFALASVFPHTPHPPPAPPTMGKFKCSSLFEAALGFAGLCP